MTQCHVVHYDACCIEIFVDTGWDFAEAWFSDNQLNSASKFPNATKNKINFLSKQSKSQRVEIEES